MTAQGRREAAYRHYVNKHMRQQQKRIAKAQKASVRHAKHPLNSEPPITEQPVVRSGAESADMSGAPMNISSSGPGEAPTTEPAP